MVVEDDDFVGVGHVQLGARPLVQKVCVKGPCPQTLHTGLKGFSLVNEAGEHRLALGTLSAHGLACVMAEVAAGALPAEIAGNPAQNHRKDERLEGRAAAQAGGHWQVPFSTDTLPLPALTRGFARPLMTPSCGAQIRLAAGKRQGAHAADIALALGYGNHPARVEEVEDV